MSDGNKTTKASTGSFSIGGQQLATSTLGKNGQSTNISFNPDQQAIWDTSTKGISSALGSISSILGGDQTAQHNTYRDNLYAPVADTINTSYDKAGNDAYSRFASLGGLNSVGFNRYSDNVLAKGRTNALANAMSAADTQAYDLPNKLLSPITTALNAYTGSQNNLYNQAMGYAANTVNGQNASNQYNTVNGLFDGSGGGGSSLLKSWLIPGYAAVNGMGGLYGR